MHPPPHCAHFGAFLSPAHTTITSTLLENLHPQNTSMGGTLCRWNGKHAKHVNLSKSARYEHFIASQPFIAFNFGQTLISRSCVFTSTCNQGNSSSIGQAIDCKRWRQIADTLLQPSKLPVKNIRKQAMQVSKARTKKSLSPSSKEKECFVHELYPQQKMH